MLVEDAFAQFERTRSRQMCEYVCVMLADPLVRWASDVGTFEFIDTTRKRRVLSGRSRD